MPSTEKGLLASSTPVSILEAAHPGGSTAFYPLLLGYQATTALPLTQAPPPSRTEARSTVSHRNFYWKQTSCSKVTLSARCPMGEVGGVQVGTRSRPKPRVDDHWGLLAESLALWAGVHRPRPDPVQNTKINSGVQLSLPVSASLGRTVALPTRPCAVGPVQPMWAAEPVGVSGYPGAGTKGLGGQRWSCGSTRVWPAAGKALGPPKKAGPGTG